MLSFRSRQGGQDQGLCLNDVLEIKLERPDGDDLDLPQVGTVNISVQGCCGWDWQTGGVGKEQRGVLWMQ